MNSQSLIDALAGPWFKTPWWWPPRWFGFDLMREDGSCTTPVTTMGDRAGWHTNCFVGHMTPSTTLSVVRKAKR